MLTYERNLSVTDLGRMAYRNADIFQRNALSSRIANTIPDTLILVEHLPVITMTRRSSPENLLKSAKELEEEGIEIAPADRGGDITYHGPGQLVAWPIFDLRNHGKDIRLFLRALEAAVIEFLAFFDIVAARIEGMTGVWVQNNPLGYRKISSIGIGIKNWVSYHGVSINIDPDPAHLSCIVPCGLKGAEQTSVAQILALYHNGTGLGHAPEMALAKEILIEKFSSVFDLHVSNVAAAAVA